MASGWSLSNAAAMVLSDTPLAAASARSEATQEAKSARAGVASGQRRGENEKDAVHASIIGDSRRGVDHRGRGRGGPRHGLFGGAGVPLEWGRPSFRPAGKP